jgi:hypothetical protein
LDQCTACPWAATHGTISHGQVSLKVVRYYQALARFQRLLDINAIGNVSNEAVLVYQNHPEISRISDLSTKP